MVRKVALIVGGSRGIGKSIALELARSKMTIYIAYLRNDRAAQETSRAISKLGGKAILFKLDVKNPDEIKQMFIEISKHHKHLDILVHCVALGVFKPLSEFAPVQLTRMFDINARSFILCVRHCLQLMKSGGSVVALSSLGGQRYVSQYGAMGIAKAALETAVRYLAVELAPQGIRVNAVSGGPVDTHGVMNLPNYMIRKKRAIKMTPAGRIASSKEIADIVCFLCARESDWIRGQVIVADGGLSLRVAGV